MFIVKRQMVLVYSWGDYIKLHIFTFGVFWGKLNIAEMPVRPEVLTDMLRLSWLFPLKI